MENKTKEQFLEAKGEDYRKAYIDNNYLYHISDILLSYSAEFGLLFYSRQQNSGQPRFFIAARQFWSVSLGSHARHI